MKCKFQKYLSPQAKNQCMKCLATINVFEISNWTNDKVLSEKF